MSDDRRALLLVTAGLSVFGVLLALLASGVVIDALDHRVRDHVAGHHSDGLYDAARWFTNVFSPPVDVLVLAVVAVALAVRRHSWSPVVVGAVSAWAVASVVLVVKYGLGRPGPGATELSVGEGSFPSGHTATVLVALGTAALLCWPGPSPQRRRALVAVAVVTALVAVALVYADFHFVSDTVASIGYGLAHLAVVERWLNRRTARPRGRASPSR